MQTMRIGWLQQLIDAPTASVIGSKISEHRDLLCAHPQECLYQTVQAEARDRDRWYEATEELLAKIRALRQREQAASLHLYPPLRNRLLWRLRNARRNRKLRRHFDAVDAQLRAQFDAALSDYQEQAGDLSAHVDERQRHMAEFWRQEDERWRRQRRGRGGNSTSGPSSTYGSDAGGGASGFAGGSF